MHSEIPSHQKIRFRREEIVCLDKLPSAQRLPAPERKRFRPGRVAMLFFGGVAVILLALVALAGAVLLGAGSETLRLEAQNAVQQLVGDDYVAAVGATRLSFDGMELLSVETDNVVLSPTGTGEEALRIGQLRLGVGFAPLIGGKLKIRRIRIQDSRIVLSSLTGTTPPAQLPFFDEAGVFDQDAAVRTVFAAANEFASLLNDGGVGRVRLQNIDLVLSDDPLLGTVKLIDAQLRRRNAVSFEVEANVAAAGRTANVQGQVSRDPSDGAVDQVTLNVAVPQETSATSGRTNDFKDARLSVSATRHQSDHELRLHTEIGQVTVDLKDGDRIDADLELRATLKEGADKIEVEALRVSSGRSNWTFHGALGSLPEGGEAGYRFELVSDGSTVAPTGSPERPLEVVTKLAGVMSATADVIEIKTIGLRSLEGEVHGSARIVVDEVGVGLGLELNVIDMPVGEIKQLWPWFSARGARRWVVDNMYGGKVEAGQIKINAAPGRLSNGVPLTASELSGEFSIKGTRFDIVGRMPPVRDGNGSVIFAGMDIDIALESGTVFMQEGRTVNARNGLLEIREAHKRPVIGRLVIDVESNADAILALASYDPIDVSRFFDVKPDELSGTVAGKIITDIPLERDFPIEKLEWKVDLAYDNLNISRKFEGQTVTKAKGSIVVDPRKAEITAAALLNGVSADLRLVEPLGQSSVERQRRVVLNLDDAGRRAIAPGLNTVLSGTARVELDDTKDSSRSIKASLERATLNIPWIGWSKGTGVPASVAFGLEQQGNVTRLSDFKLDGDTFGATGALSLVDGKLQSVSFPSARLNRNDDFSFTMKAERNGYDIEVRGKSIDVRSIVKLYAGAGENRGENVDTGPVRVDVAVDAMTGFHGESLRGVTLKFAGTNGRTDKLEFAATTSTGGKVAFSDTRNGDARSVTMTSADAGAILRFLDVYEHMEGGAIALSMRGTGTGPLSGQVDTRNFWIVNEPRLRSLVSSTPAGGDRSLNQAVRGDIDTTRVQFERAFSLVATGNGALDLDRGVLRGPLIGSTFQGRVYDAAGNMDMTGTFMPAYGLNRIFGEIPLIGQLLGNGRDRGLIGITFKLSGKYSEPQLQVNPLSVIAPGIFRSVFEFR
ncbi:AsmA-like C-terminal region [Aquamicrobium aerolatum DSM 21857]|uniref:AsmA-like C-terminal region n=2 Tax=Aerobium TaxID=3143707 RepID=A0A1I3KU97_9HYPH|nr:AsmA-like C-terminal region [Aquamicrobium aerolatum DSM 21857]